MPDRICASEWFSTMKTSTFVMAVGACRSAAAGVELEGAAVDGDEAVSDACACGSGVVASDPLHALSRRGRSGSRGPRRRTPGTVPAQHALLESRPWI
ncbi:hypothetical protein GCM10009798_17310 [Nocardioides panacihumi]|uniref:Secreted protein n=1 Tax=Nocardioides panacihumi TaxID=400774 RepID=A0ABN2QUF1_9ACTN